MLLVFHDDQRCYQSPSVDRGSLTRHVGYAFILKGFTGNVNTKCGETSCNNHDLCYTVCEVKTMATFGERLRECRKVAKLTQKDLAHAARSEERRVG